MTTMKTIACWKVGVTYFTSFCMLAGGLHWAFFFTIVGAVSSFDVYAVDELKNKLEQKYDLSTAKNVDGVDLYNKVLSKNTNGGTSNPALEQDLINTDYGPGQALEFDQYPVVDFDAEFRSYLSDGLGVEAKAPTMTNGNIDAEYYEKAGVKIERDANGNLVSTSVPISERGVKKSSIHSSEAFSSQQDRPDAEFNAPSNYGDEDAYIEDMRAQYINSGTGKTMESEAYRAIIKASTDNPAQVINSDAYFLDAGNKALSDAANGEGIWSQTCKDETIVETDIKQIPIWENKICAQPNHQNMDFCEVTRVLESNPQYIQGKTPQYVEVYTQNPEGCADRLGWRPECPPNTDCMQPPVSKVRSYSSSMSAQKTSMSVQSVSALSVPSETGSKKSSMNAQKTSMRVQSVPVSSGSSVTNLKQSNARSLLSGQSNGSAILSVSPMAASGSGYPIRPYDESAASRWETVSGSCSHVGNGGIICTYKGNGYVGVFDGQAYKATQCSFDQQNEMSVSSTCLFVPFICAPTEMPSFQDIYNKNDQVGENGPIKNVGGYDYVPTNCQGVSPHAPDIMGCDYQLACLKTPVCEVTSICEGYTPQFPVDDFCTFDEWEIIDQGTYNYNEKVINQISKMFAGDPNPGPWYGGDENGNDQYQVATWKINAKGYSCDPLRTNEYCVDVLNEDTQQFEEQCYTYEEFKALEGNCQQFKDNQRCEKTGSSCAEGWFNSKTGICYMYTDDYRCDVSNPLEVTKTTTKNVCAAMLPCMGNDCNIGEDEASDDFEKAVLMGSVAQTVDDDASCVGEDPNTCEIFPGEEKYCSWELSGLGNNCCESPEGVNYLEMAALGYKMMQTDAFKTVSSNLGSYVPDAVGGMYTDFTNMIADGWNAGSKVVVDFTSSIMGDTEVINSAAESVSSGAASASEAVSTMLHSMQQNVYSFINGALPEELASLMFQEATAEMVDQGAAQAGDLVLGELASTMMSIVSFVGLIYTIYNVVKLLANLLTQCDEVEQDMGVKLAQRQCFKVGNKYCAEDILGVCYLRRQNYCCFSSILSRIIADQGSKQIGKNMNGCPGFTIEEFGTIDFDRLDLSEWLSTMYESDILSTSGYDVERLTGTGRTYGNVDCSKSEDPECVDSERKNANERANEQFKEGMSDDTNQLKETFSPEQVDCSIYPRPLICEMGG